MTSGSRSSAASGPSPEPEVPPPHHAPPDGEPVTPLIPRPETPIMPDPEPPEPEVEPD